MNKVKEREVEKPIEFTIRYNLDDLFLKIKQSNFSKTNLKEALKVSYIETPLGLMVAIASDHALYLLEFLNRKALEKEVKELQKKLDVVMALGENYLIRLIKKELGDYFSGALQTFKTPIALLGSSFQKKVWEELKKIPFGETISYKTLAMNINRPTAFRAVANANSFNQLALIIPCHRVINTDGKLGGYAAGLSRKKWLIEHEAKSLKGKS